MFRMFRLMALVFVLVGVISTAAAQDANRWSMYLIDNTTSELLRVFADGTTQTYNLNLPPNTYIGGRELAFTDDGDRVAACITTYSGEAAQTTLRFLDLAAQPAPAELWSVPLEGGQGCWLALNESGDQLAISRVYRYPSPDESNGTANPLPLYGMTVVNVSDGSTVMTFDPRAANLPTDHPMMLDVRRFADGEIIAAMVPWATEGYPIPPAYRISVPGGAVQEVDQWWHTGVDYLPATDELTWVELVESIPAAEPMGPIPVANTIMYADGSGQSYPIYRNSEWILLDTEFINNGAALAILEIEGVNPQTTDPNMMGGGGVRWTVLERDGSSRVLTETRNALSQVVSAPDGYAHFYSTPLDGSLPEAQIIVDYHVMGQEPVMLWSTETTQGITWSFVWAQPTTAASDLVPFPPVE